MAILSVEHDDILFPRSIHAKWDVFNVIYLLYWGIFFAPQILCQSASAILSSRAAIILTGNFIMIFPCIYVLFLRTFSSGPIWWYRVVLDLLIADILVICTFLYQKEKKQRRVKNKMWQLHFLFHSTDIKLTNTPENGGCFLFSLSFF